ncbi:integration host factor subunit beta [Flavobacterium suaedae]|uniref:Integration host factor subunit beta n=1 Tax=Flavobacterium suaedae TaxID=1767027 RepID=A0ABQ1K200_9FLAO|nr:integration host factor subunit beta [Flavobacterium suaedae]
MNYCLFNLYICTLEKNTYTNINLRKKMTKADIVAKISEKLGLEKGDVQATVESFMEEVKNSLETGDNVYLRGFGSFIIKTRAEKTGRNISKNTTIKIPAHNIPAFKPAKIFVDGVKMNTEVKN